MKNPGGTKADGILVEHWCRIPAPKSGSFGFDSKYGTDWYYMEHRPVELLRAERLDRRCWP